ncbi:expressed unknown protein [Seminavis robusta]|uniref:Uncharacterized protein n=1 Tax=Seminavis robusta TaxID=568900 RepID=A0A9N8DXQ9_9STRA|nr:expressed unknown protein [Seminavis robusta]|eukprot:Sro428_g140830.1 n/a (564) ;mRNA; f:21359-23050
MFDDSERTCSMSDDDSSELVPRPADRETEAPEDMVGIEMEALNKGNSKKSAKVISVVTLREGARITKTAMLLVISVLGVAAALTWMQFHHAQSFGGLLQDPGTPDSNITKVPKPENTVSPVAKSPQQVAKPAVSANKKNSNDPKQHEAIKQGTAIEPKTAKKQGGAQKNKPNAAREPNQKAAQEPQQHEGAHQNKQNAAPMPNPNAVQKPQKQAGGPKNNKQNSAVPEPNKKVAQKPNQSPLDTNHPGAPKPQQQQQQSHQNAATQPQQPMQQANHGNGMQAAQQQQQQHQARNHQTQQTHNHPQQQQQQQKTQTTTGPQQGPKPGPQQGQEPQPKDGEQSNQLSKPTLAAETPVTGTSGEPVPVANKMNVRNRPNNAMIMMAGKLSNSNDHVGKQLKDDKNLWQQTERRHKNGPRGNPKPNGKPQKSSVSGDSRHGGGMMHHGMMMRHNGMNQDAYHPTRPDQEEIPEIPEQQQQSQTSKNGLLVDLWGFASSLAPKVPHGPQEAAMSPENEPHEQQQEPPSALRKHPIDRPNDENRNNNNMDNRNGGGKRKHQMKRHGGML